MNSSEESGREQGLLDFENSDLRTERSGGIDSKLKKSNSRRNIKMSCVWLSWRCQEAGSAFKIICNLIYSQYLMSMPGSSSVSRIVRWFRRLSIHGRLFAVAFQGLSTQERSLSSLEQLDDIFECNCREKWSIGLRGKSPRVPGIKNSRKFEFSRVNRWAR